MRIGIDCRLVLDKPTGIGTYTVGLVRDLLRLDARNEYVLIVRERAPAALQAVAASRASFVPCPLPPMGLKQKLLAARFLRPLQLDVYHYPHHDLPLGLESRTVVTIHHVPEPGVSTGPPAVFNPLLTWSVGWAVRRAKKVITVSRFTATRLVARFGHTEKVVPIYPPASDLFDAMDEAPLPEGIRAGRYFLFVGQRRPHKNLERLIEAFACPELEGFQLVIAGPTYKDYRKPEQFVEELGLRQRVFLLGSVDNPLLRALYRQALCLVLPSLLEGFGYPVAEALRFGLPAICSDRGSLPEILGDAGLLVDPMSTQSLTAAMVRLAKDPSLRQGLSERAQRRSQLFSGERSARAVLEVYRQVAEG
ncbi:MAG: glycosyltransferase family 4 protein [candidate division KSB1 bacterium]|nr:glycosyltransferase family 4 protein [candidate division KSB1 bacterium]